ncbi:MAG TPA: hypothetical protein VIM61_04170 [Chthoniobacterales bacterium]|jgi:hypothetical protein
MQRFRPILFLTLALVATSAAFAGAKKQSAVSVRFHAEGGSEGGEFSQPVELINPRRKTNMQALALISERDIKSFYPYPATDGSGTFGASFRLDSHGSNLLGQHTMSRQGSYLLAYFNGRHVIDLYIDRAVTDGIISIPSSLTPADIAALELTFPLMGHENEKPGKKKPVQKDAPPPKASEMPRMQPATVRQADGSLAPAQSSGAAPSGEVIPRSVSPVGQ